jgi:cell division protein FtsA
VVGLDIGTTKICAIVAEVTEEGTVNVVGVGSSPSRGLRKGVVVNIESTVESIKKAVEEAELMAAVQINSVYTGIAGSHISGENSRGVVALKKQEVTRVDVQRAVDTARSVAVLPSDRRILHVLPREFMVDDQDGIREPLGMSGSRLEVDVHIITGAVTSAQNIIKSVNRAGLDVVDMVLQPLASSEAVLTPEERELGVAMVDLGGGTTDLAIFAEGSIRHTAVLPIGGQHLTTDLAIGLRTPQGEAERLKIRKGVALAELVKDDEMVDVPGVGDRPARTLSRKLLAEITEPRVEEMFDLVRREIMRAGYEGILAAGVVITGGTSMLEGMLEAAERVLDLPVRRGVPNGVGGLRDIVSNPMYATGVGLILLARHHAGELELTGLRGGRRVGRALGRMRAWMLEFF